jgi:hypothetical protein
MTTSTAVYLKVPEGYVAFVEELPGANTQGATLEDGAISFTIWSEMAASCFVRTAITRFT